MERIRINTYIRMLRICAGYTRACVASRLGITESAYGHYETARNDITFSCYLPDLADFYNIDLHVMRDLTLVDSNLLELRPPLTPSEHLADFLIFFNTSANEVIYKYLTLEEKWCVYYLNRCKNKKALLSIMSAAPVFIDNLPEDETPVCPWWLI